MQLLLPIVKRCFRAPEFFAELLNGYRRLWTLFWHVPGITARRTAAFGRSIASSGPQTSSFGFQGQADNDATGQGVFRNRNYSTQQGRFISQDPIRFASGQTNMYSLANDHPHMGTDPSGLTEPIGQIGNTAVVPSMPNDIPKALQIEMANGSINHSHGDGSYTAIRRDGSIARNLRGPKSSAMLRQEVQNSNAEASVASGFLALTPPVEIIPEPVRNRIEAIPRLAGGTVEIIGGLGGEALPTGVTQIAGAVVIVHGADNVSTALMVLWDGQNHDTMTTQVIELGAYNAGFNADTAHNIGVGGDLVIGLGGSAGYSRFSSVGSSPINGVNRIRTANAVSEVETYTAKQFAASISDNPVAYRAYLQMRDRVGVDITLDFGTKATSATGRVRRIDEIEIFYQNNSNVREAVATFVHESRHISDLDRGLLSILRPTQTAEYRAFRREFLFEHGRRPTMTERGRIWEHVGNEYSGLPLR